VQTGDFNADGLADIVGRQESTGKWVVLRSTGTTFVNEKWGRWNPSINWVNVHVGAFAPMATPPALSDAASQSVIGTAAAKTQDLPSLDAASQELAEFSSEPTRALTQDLDESDPASNLIKIRLADEDYRTQSNARDAVFAGA
jgi:hypothetical protein